MANREEALQSIANVVRAIVNSSKPPVSLQSVLKDYRNEEGRDLEYRRFNFNSPKELLHSTGQFSFTTYGHDELITAKYSKNSEHIASMVRNQKRSTSKGSIKRPTPLPPKPKVYRQPYNPPPPQQYNQGISTQLDLENIRQQVQQYCQLSGNQILQRLQAHLHEQCSQQQTTFNEKFQKWQTESQRINQLHKDELKKLQEKLQHQQALLDSRFQNELEEKKSSSENSAPPKEDNFMSRSESQQKVTTTPVAPMNRKPLTENQPLRAILGNSANSGRTVNGHSRMASAPHGPPHSVGSNQFAPRTAAPMLSRPPTSSVNERLKLKIPQVVNGNGLIPDLKESVKTPISTVTSNLKSGTGDNQFIDILHKELLKHPNGIVSKKLPQWFAQATNQQVPENWYQLLVESPKIRLEEGVSILIVFAEEAIKLQSPIQSPHVPTKVTTSELILPWAEASNGWSMFITYGESTTQVWGRLIDGECSRDFDKLSQELNAHMSQIKLQRIADNLHIQQIYTVMVNDFWNRVRLVSIDEEQRKCSCFCIDFGDILSFGYDEIFICEPRFLQVPPQAICMSLYGLENFNGHPYAQTVLDKELIGHTVVAKVMTSKEQYMKSQGDGQSRIIALLYDTSTAEDIELNEKIVSKINDQTPLPQLKLEQKSNAVLVSYIHDSGDLYVLIPGKDLTFVRNSIAKTMASNWEQHRVVFADLQRDYLFFVCEELTSGVKQWHRGKLVKKPKSEKDETFDVYLVDDGRTRETHISNLYRLEALSKALAAFPAQALRIRLHDVPTIDNHMVSRLRGIMSPQTEVLVKVVEGASDKLPMVIIHARGKDGLYLCVNSAIRMEYELQRTTRLEPFDDGGLHFSPQGQLLRRSSFSSTVSSNSTTSSDFTTTASSPARISPTLKAYEAIPAIGAYFEVRVALSVNPSHFAVQPYKSYGELQRMMKELQAFCVSAQAERVLPAQLGKNQAYATQDSDGLYHRVIVYKIYDEMIHVRFVDYGDDSVVRCDQLIHLPPTLRTLPKMALPARLHGIKIDGVEWTKENCIRFRELTLGQKFIGIVRNVHTHNGETRELCLELIDTSTPKDIKVHEIMINEKHAQPVN